MDLRSAIAKVGRRVAAPVPARSGVGLKPQHYRDILEDMPDIGWFEVHPEHYMGAYRHHMLELVRAHYPLSLHGGSAPDFLLAEALGGLWPLAHSRAFL
jgi:hypothetical protein